MKALTIMLAAICSFITSSAQETDKVKELEQRLIVLEQRMAKVEYQNAYAMRATQTPEQKKMMEIARKRIADGQEGANSEDIDKAERLYLNASKDLANNASKKILDSIVYTYPKLNRAGCAQLYRSQQENGEEMVRLLNDCITRFSQCYYYDGTQVGPYATFRLANYYKQIGKVNEANKLFNKLRSESPEAVDHHGVLLVTMID